VRNEEKKKRIGKKEKRDNKEEDRFRSVDAVLIDSSSIFDLHELMLSFREDRRPHS